MFIYANLSYIPLDSQVSRFIHLLQGCFVCGEQEEKIRLPTEAQLKLQCSMAFLSNQGYSLMPCQKQKTGIFPWR